MDITNQIPPAEPGSALTPEEQSQLEEAIKKARDGWAHGKKRRIEVGQALIVIKALWDTLDRGKFKREIRDVTDIPYTTSLDYMEEAKAASTNSVLSADSEEAKDPPPFQKGTQQDDPDDEELKRLTAEEKKKAAASNQRSNEGNHSTLALRVHHLSVQQRESFMAWQKDHKQTCEALFHEVVMCVLDTGVGAHKAVIALMDLRPTPSPVIQVEEAEVLCVQ